MKKRTYRAHRVKDTDLNALIRDEVGPLTLGVDIAKHLMFGVVMNEHGDILAVLKWGHLSESRRFVSWVSKQPKIRAVVMEPSGTYGDALRHCFQASGVAVYRVHPKHVKDSQELFDGVPSTHDAKASSIIAWLHQLGRSELWEPESERARQLAAALSTLHLHQDAFVPAQNRLEATLVRYWPEVLPLLALDSVTLLELLGRFGGPDGIARQPAEAEALMREAGRNGLSEDKIEAVLDAAHEHLGVRMTPPEEAALQELAQEARRRQRALQSAKKRLETLSLLDPETLAVGEQVGRVTSVVLVHGLGSLRGYSNTGSLLKAAGLNLREISSGQHQGDLRITKRGPRRVRQFLYLAVLRWIQKDPWARAWYDLKVQRDGTRIKRKAIVALMRKLLKGLWVAAQGETFDSSKLFDTQRLEAASG